MVNAQRDRSRLHARMHLLNFPSRKQQARVGEDPSMETNVILTPKDTYRMNTYFPSLDTVIVELSSRFGEDEKDVDQNILCALARIVIKKSGSDDDFRILSDTVESTYIWRGQWKNDLSLFFKFF